MIMRTLAMPLYALLGVGLVLRFRLSLTAFIFAGLVPGTSASLDPDVMLLAYSTVGWTIGMHRLLARLDTKNRASVKNRQRA